jgi:dynein heavy chain
MVKPGVIRDEATLTRLWIHEISRVFHDRLINNEDRIWFYDSIIELLGRYFRVNWNKEELFEKGFIIFGDLLRLDSGTKDYEEIKEMKKLIKVLEDKLDVMKIQYSFIHYFSINFYI